MGSCKAPLSHHGDDLLEELNQGSPEIPWCLFYADDGVLLLNSQADLERLIGIVEAWTLKNDIMLNPAKCGIITANDLQPVRVYRQRISLVDRYQYLGFPVTKDGVDFETFLSSRIEAALAKANFLGVQSKGWVVADRLGVYKQFLAPMFEYGAPLIWAWSRKRRAEFDAASKGFSKLIAWISNTSTGRWKITANLLGLLSLLDRFQLPHTRYQWILSQMTTDSPLRCLLRQAIEPFSIQLRTQVLYERFKKTSNF